MRTVIICHHLIFTGHGFWLPNDPRGSGSTEVRNPDLEKLGPILPGRQKKQPSRDELKKFYCEANNHLEHQPLWFDLAKRQALADAFSRVTSDFNYTVYACAILSNHAHLIVRRHRDDAQTIWDVYAGASREELRHMEGVPTEHPIWSKRPCKVFLHTPQEVRDRIDYVNNNPAKEGLPPQHHAFVSSYDGWPLARK